MLTIRGQQQTVQRADPSPLEQDMQLVALVSEGDAGHVRPAREIVENVCLANANEEQMPSPLIETWSKW